MMVSELGLNSSYYIPLCVRLCGAVAELPLDAAFSSSILGRVGIFNKIDFSLGLGRMVEQNPNHF